MNHQIRNHRIFFSKTLSVAIVGLAIVLLSLYMTNNHIQEEKNQRMALINQSRITISDLEAQLACCNITRKEMERRFECNVAHLDDAQWNVIRAKHQLEEVVGTLEGYKKSERLSSNNARTITIDSADGEITRSKETAGQREMSEKQEIASFEMEQSRMSIWLITIAVLLLLIIAFGVPCYRHWVYWRKKSASDLQVSVGSTDGKAKALSRKYPNEIYKFLSECPGSMICTLRCSEQTVEYVFGVAIKDRKTILSGWCNIPQWMHCVLSRVQLALGSGRENVQNPPAIAMGDTIDNSQRDEAMTPWIEWKEEPFIRRLLESDSSDDDMELNTRSVRDGPIYPRDRIITSTVTETPVREETAGQPEEATSVVL